MSRQRLGLLLAAAVIVIAAAMLVSTQRNASHDTVGVALLPGLAADLNSVTAVMVRKGSATPNLTLHLAGTRWAVAERADFPADTAKLRKLLESLRDAKIVEEKTSDPTRYAVIGVEDPAAASAPGAEVTVVTARGKSTLIVGKTVGDGNYVRRGGEPRSYSVEPGIALETEPKFWIDARLLDVPAALIQRIEVKPAAGPSYVLNRLNPADNTFGLDGVPAGRKAVDGHQLAPQPSLLTGLNAEDVAPVADVNFAAATVATITLSDGNTLSIVGAAAGDKHWVQIKSSKDAALTTKADGRAFEIASYRYDALFRPLDQLLEPLPQKTSPPTSVPAAVKKKAPAAQSTPAPTP